MAQHPQHLAYTGEHTVTNCYKAANMFRNRLLSAVGLVLAFGTSTTQAERRLGPSFPPIPPDYQNLQPQKLVNDAKVTFPAYYVDRTNGYRVTTPSGTEFVVDSITEPKCAFYATYVNTDDEGYLGVGGGTTVESNVYIGEVNFDHCQ
jgi:hypothetical protein